MCERVPRSSIYIAGNTQPAEEFKEGSNVMSNLRKFPAALTPFCESIYHILLHTKIRGNEEYHDLLDSIDLA